MTQWKCTDPRGPSVTVLAVEPSPTGGPTILSLSCGHRVERVNHFSYRVGELSRCFTCKQEAETK